MRAKSGSLKPGYKGLWRGHVLEVIKRVPRAGKIEARNIFYCSDFLGMMGPEDRGLISLSDRQFDEVEDIFKKESRL